MHVVESQIACNSTVYKTYTHADIRKTSKHHITSPLWGKLTLKIGSFSIHLLCVTSSCGCIEKTGLSAGFWIIWAKGWDSPKQWQSRQNYCVQLLIHSLNYRRCQGLIVTLQHWIKISARYCIIIDIWCIFAQVYNWMEVGILFQPLDTRTNIGFSGIYIYIHIYIYIYKHIYV